MFFTEYPVFCFIFCFKALSISSPGIILPPGKHHPSSFASLPSFLFPISIFFFAELKIIPRTITSNFGFSFSMMLSRGVCFYLFGL